MLDLEPYRPVSTMPPVRRDLSIVVDAPTSTPRQLGDRVREGVAPDVLEVVEEVAVMSETPAALPPAEAIARIGLRARTAERAGAARAAASDAHADGLGGERDARRRLRGGIHEGSVYEWAGRKAAP